MKTRSQKVICILACIFLLASFFVVSVSAEEEDVQSKVFEISYNRGLYRDYLAHCKGTESVNGFDLMSGESFFDCIESVYGDTVTVGSSDYDYIQYSLAGDDIFSRNFDNMISYAYAESYISSAGIDWFNFRLYDVSFRFHCSIKMMFSKIRFSLRTYDPKTKQVGLLLAVSDSFELGDLTGSDNGSMYRFVNTSSINFKNTSLNSVAVYPYSVLCVDLLFTASPPAENYYIAFDMDSTFFVQQYKEATGPNQVFIPGLDDPIYRMPDNSIAEDMLQIQEGVLGSSGDMNDMLSSVVDDYEVGLNDFASGLQSVSLLLDYVTKDLPFLNYVLIISLALGLFSLFFGIVGSSVSASSDAIKSSARSDFVARSDRNSNKK